MNFLKSNGIKLFVLVTIVTLLLASKFSKPNADENLNIVSTSSPDSQFIIGAFHNGTDFSYYYKDSLGFNTWHYYSNIDDGWFGNSNDAYNKDTSLYKSMVTSTIDKNNNQKSMRTFMDRPIIQYLVGGQRIDYQCEYIAPNFQANPYWYYAYNNSTLVNNNTHFSISDEFDTEHGVVTKVKYCNKLDDITLDNDIIINSKLRANREMSFNSVNPWLRDTAYNWFILPKIRIDSAYAADVNHFNDVICKIVVTGWKDSVEAEFDLKVSSFRKNISTPYNGSYIESFFDSLGNSKYLTISKSKIKNFTDPTKFVFEWKDSCYCDIKIYWTGKCDMWIDQVRLENEPAHEYLTLKDQTHDKWVSKVNSEIYWAVRNYDPQNPKPNYFYFEECQMSHFPVIKELNRQITAGSGNKNELVIWPNYDLFKAHVPDCWNYQFDSVMLKRYIYTEYGLRNIVMGSYALEGWGDYELQVNDRYRNSFHPSSLTGSVYDSIHGILSNPKSPADYDTWIQEHFDDPVHPSGVNYSYISKLMFSLSKEPGMRVLNCPQDHLWYASGHKLKEPSNEELELMANLAITNNAKGLIWFSYVCEWTNIGAQYYARGIMDNGGVPRDSNVYGQNKYSKVCAIDSMLERRGPYIMSFDPTLTKNCIYRLEEERNTFITNTYFSNIITYKPGSGEPACTSQNPGGNLPTGLTYECNDDRYIQAATFRTSTSDIYKYFMIVNRRCSPYIDESSPDNRGGRRNIRVKFDLNSSDFVAHNNWEIIDLDSNKTVAKVDMGSGAIIDLGWYNPGQGKLYKISPTVLNGGTLIADETISGNVNCNGMIYSNGHNITISPNAVVTFSDSAGIEMNGGCFVSGVNADNADDVTLTGKTETTFWKGITLIGCDSIGVYNTNISNIKANDTAKAFSIINSYKVNFRKNTINANSNSGGIQAVYNTFSDNPIVFNIRECNFNMNQSGYSAISVLSNASVTLPIITEWCTFISQNDTSNAILFTEVTGGAIKNNIFTNFGKSVVLMYSTTDFYGNTILGKNNSQGILCLSGSYASLSPTSGQYLGGYNYIKNYGNSASNVYSNNSYFNIQNGQNDFDLSDIDNSKHLTGDLSGIPYSYVNATKNCFHKDSITNIDATHTVFWYDNSPVNFIFTDYSCELTPPGDFFVYQYGGYYDTVYYRSGGEGSGFNPNKPNKPMNIEENVYKSLKDSININLRKRNYLTVENKAKQLLSQYPDSLESATMVQKLYMASLSLDSTKIGIAKTFLENLIAANTQNPTLIKRAFYFIQKCKVKLGQYQSALDGFQYIMTQNPYTYEGLVASWDYAATYLLMGSGGSYKGENEEQTEELNTPADTLLNRMTKSDISTNKSKNTNSNRNSTEQITKTFYEKIKNVTKDDKTAQEEKMKILEKKIETTKSKTEKNDAITELATMKQKKK